MKTDWTMLRGYKWSESCCVVMTVTKKHHGTTKDHFKGIVHPKIKMKS